MQHVAELDELLPLATQKAAELAPLGANREIYGGQKERLFGENAALNLPHGAAYMLKNSDKFSH